MGKPREYYQITRPKRSKDLSNVLSEENVYGILNSPKNLKHKAILYTIYSGGFGWAKWPGWGKAAGLVGMTAPYCAHRGFRDGGMNRMVGDSYYAVQPIAPSPSRPTRLFGHSSSKTTEIHTRVLSIGNKTLKSPLDSILEKAMFDRTKGNGPS